MRALLLAAVLLGAGVARAEPPPVTSVELSGGVGGMMVAHVWTTTFATRLGFGRTMGPFHVEASGMLMSLTQPGLPENSVPPPRSGAGGRATLALRYDVMAFGAGYFQVHAWAEAGVGREWLTWDGGGRIERNQVEVGFLMDVQARFGSHIIDAVDGFQFLMAPDPDGGPLDTGFMFVIGFRYGR